MDALETLKKTDREVYLLRHTQALLGWDQETYMPSRAVEERADQLALLEGLIHQRISSPRTLDALAELEGGLSPDGAEDGDGESGGKNLAAVVRLWRRSCDRAVKIPQALAERRAKAASVGQARWARAKTDSCFAAFRPCLQEILGCLRETAAAIGYQDHPYDALVDEYEPSMKTKTLDGLFESLRQGLAPLAGAVAAAPQVGDDFLRVSCPVETQKTFCAEILKAMGFDAARGRLDESAHPFTATLGAHDVRITTRYIQNDLKSAIFSLIHECGHALYEMGFGHSIQGTLLADGASLGIHESQSRLWENMIGRSLPFWEFWFPRLHKHFPALPAGLRLGDFYKAINKVSPSLIRTEADELTYNLHIILRFLLEKDLASGKLAAQDIPEAWRELSKNLLGIAPENDAEGCLQDIHWSMGAVGYFPTYALGNLYAARFFAAMRREIPGLEAGISQGRLGQAGAWLAAKIHRHGAGRRAETLAREVGGGPLDCSCFIRYLTDKYSGIYDI
jgi:carboxypeptidase Taq